MLTSDALLCGYVGDERALAYYSKAIAELGPLSLTQRSLDEDIAHRAQIWRGEFRASVPPARIMEFIQAAQPTQWAADAAFGIVLGSGDQAAIDRAATQVGGTTGTTAPPPAQRDLLVRLKQAFDPDNQLAPLPS
jgi:hypothetical protein